MQESSNWTSELARSFRTLPALYDFLGWQLDDGEAQVAEKYPVFIPRSLAEKIKLQGQKGVLAREFLPETLELDSALNLQGLADPIGDKVHHVAPQLIHRYPSRVLFTPTNVCPVHCRYCFRKNELNQKDELFSAEFSETIQYLMKHPEISEVIFTGGDPFTLSNNKIALYLRAFSNIPHIRDVRFHTRYPVILPERIDEGLLEVLSENAEIFRTVSVAIHANHVDEFDEVSMAAIRKLGKLPIQLLSQSVLLKGVNDRLEDLFALFELFLNLKVRPYYLHHPDQVEGAMHFYLPLEDGRRIYAQLRSRLPGWGIPQYILDVPGGSGKIAAFNPESWQYSGKILSLQGELLESREPNL